MKVLYIRLNNLMRKANSLLEMKKLTLMKMKEYIKWWWKM